MEGNIYSAMAQAMMEIGAITKGRTNTQQGFKFRGIDDVYNELHDILAKYKIFTVPEVLDDRTEERTSSKGNALIYRVLRMKYTFVTDDGSQVSCVVMGEGMDSGDKAANKAMSIAHKYALFQTFLIPTEDEKDPDGQSHEIKPKTPKETVKDYVQDAKGVIENAITDGQKESIKETLKTKGKKMAFISETLGRKIEKWSDLTYDEAERVLVALQGVDNAKSE